VKETDPTVPALSNEPVTGMIHVITVIQLVCCGVIVTATKHAAGELYH